MVPVTASSSTRSLPSRGELLRRAPLIVTLAVVLLVVTWVLFWATDPGSSGWTTTYGPAIHDPIGFLTTVLDSLTYAGLLFVVASGFTLIFGLMRVVNMAHGSYFLLGGLITYKLQQEFAHGGGFGLQTSQVNVWQWVLPAIIASACIAVVGLFTQQFFLRWNQGQDLRQALITIAISVIVADQLQAHFNAGNEQSISWPDFLGVDKQLNIGSLHYAWSRLFMLFVAIGIGGVLWIWLQKTRTGMVIRAGVDDRHMVSALGVNIQLTFAIAFIVGAALAGFGGAMGGSFAGLVNGVDGQWLLNALIVVIIGGMGSLGGAAAGAVLLAFVTDFSGVYLPTYTDPVTAASDCCTEYSIVLTFVLLAFVLALRPLGLFGRPA
jgi:branched-chain amino acid transport system permease protein